MSPEQCRAARAWIGLSQEDLAKAASIGLSTLRDYEKGARTPVTNNLAAIRTVLEGKGFAFSERGAKPESLTYAPAGEAI